MKITFENYDNKQNVDKAKTTYSSPRTEKNDSKRGFALDISGTVMDNTAYGVQGRTAEDIMQQAENIDVTTQRNYMTVMSNSMSSEDFAKLQEEGYHPGDITIEETVTITDHIKAELAKAGVDVKGYTDNVSEEAMEEVAGSQVSAQQIIDKLDTADAAVTEENIGQVRKAYEQASHLSELSDGVKKYMVENGMEPTIEDLYKAQFSGNTDAEKQGRGYYADGTAGYYSMKAEEYDWQQLEPQMKKVIEEAGLEVNEETIGQAKWIIEKGIPLTQESIGRLNELESLELPMTADKLLSAIAGTVGSGKPAKETNLADTESNMDKAVRYMETVASISDEAVDYVAGQGKELNLKNLEEAQRKIDSRQAVFAEVNITARRKMEEIRLQMTIEANLKLLESGYRIDTTELEQLVEDLKAIEKEQNQVLFHTQDTQEAQSRAALYEETRTKTAQIPGLPAAAVGKAAFSEKPTMDFIHQAGTELKRSYEAAGESYETMMTTPRSDMGDSIQKAFRNVDDILQDMGLELTEQNRRAVRILGYNSMEITPENILAVKDADLDIKKAVERMTPAATMEMIREGVNPLEMTIAELNEYFDKKDNEPGEQALKYSKYLYKLEKNHEITENEREAYIGIYRFFRQMEKSDGAAIGAVVNAGGELSFKNLMTAVRSEKKSGMDYTVDDDFGGIIDLSSKTNSITEQIAKGFGAQAKDQEAPKEQKYYEKVSKQILDHLEPEKVQDIEISGDTTLEEFAEQLEEAGRADELEAAYNEEQLKEFMEAQHTDDETLRFLLDTGESVTVNNLLAADRWLKRPGSAFDRLNRMSEKFKQASEQVKDAFDDEVSAKEGYGRFTEEVFSELASSEEAKEVTAVDLKEIHLLYKQMNLARESARQEDYQIPVRIGEEMTSVRLRVIRGADEAGKVKVTMNTAKYGLAEAEFKINGSTLEGFIAVNKEEGLSDLRGIETKMKEALSDSDLHITDFHFVQSDRIDTNAFMREEQAETTHVSSVQLYRTAKAFLQAVGE